MQKDHIIAKRFLVIKSFKGGMGEVFILRDLFNKKVVAAKTPYGDFESFSRECLLWLGLGKHPNIVRAHTVHNIDDRPFLFMDFIGDNNANSKNLRSETISYNDPILLALRTGISVLRALCHSNRIFPGFVHRDLKPENILVDGSKNLFVSGFGIGHIPKNLNYDLIKQKLSRTGATLPGFTEKKSNGSFCGTLGYAAPEQYIDPSAVTFRADLFSLGIILFEILTGEIPIYFEGLEKDAKILFEKFDGNSNTATNRQNIELWKIIHSLLRFDQIERPGSIEKLESQFLEVREKLYSIKNDRLERFEIKQDKITIVNRINALIELKVFKLATENLIYFQRRFAFSPYLPSLINRVYNSLPDDENSALLRALAKKDIFSIKKSFGLLALASFLFGPSFYALTKSNIHLSEFIMTTALLCILFIEKYINSRTRLTPDFITLPGILGGVSLTTVFWLMNLPSLPGNFLFSLAGIMVGGTIPLTIAWGYQLKTKREGVGGGTIKLLAMIGSWTGVTVFWIILLSFFLMVIIGIILEIVNKEKFELKWKNDTVTIKVFYRLHNSMPTSYGIFVATWIVISAINCYSITW